MNFFVITNIAASLAVLAVVGAAILFFFRPRSILERSLAFYLLSTAIWLGGNVCADVSYTVSALWLTSGIAFVGGTLSTFSFLILVDILIDRRFPSWWRIVTYGVPNGILAAFAFSSYAIVETYFPPHAPALIIPGPAYAYALYILLASFIYGSVRLFLHMKKERNTTMRMQIAYVTLGLLLTLTGETVFTILLPIFGEERFYSLGPVSSVFFAALCTMAIVRHKLIDIRIVVQRGLIYSMLLTGALGVYFALLILTEALLRDSFTIHVAASAAITMLLGIFAAEPLKRFFEKLTDPIFYKDRYDYAKVLTSLTDVLNRNLVEDSIIKKSKDILNRALKPVTLEFYLLSKEVYKGAECELSIPIRSHQKLIGTLCLGGKLSGDAYSSQDLHLLDVFVNQAGIALEKASLYKKVQEYADTLETKVEERTRKIAQIQKDQESMMLEISHGLKTPLTIMKGELFFLRKSGYETARIDSMNASIDRIAAFIERLLSLSRLESEIGFERTSFSLTNLLTDVVTYFEDSAGRNQITIILDASRDAVMMGDRASIEELFSNLVSNACKYMDPAREKKVTISLQAREHAAVVTVHDTGIGMTKEQVEKLFTKFYRAQDRSLKDVPGTGLGLALCKKIVELHKGSISVQSVYGAGTTFTVTLPVSSLGGAS